jgi:hypothetical protein
MTAATTPSAAPARRDYSVCPENPDGRHGPLRAGIDPETATTHVTVDCAACMFGASFPIAELDAGRLSWG